MAVCCGLVCWLDLRLSLTHRVMMEPLDLMEFLEPLLVKENQETWDTRDPLACLVGQ